MSEPLCSLCRTPVAPGEEVVACPACQAPAHRECRDENGGCGTYGCPESPAPEKQAAGPAPVAVWGRETKSCPKCRRAIRAAALRCRWCGAVFDSVESVDPATFAATAERKRRTSELKKQAPGLLVAGLFPPTAPLLLMIGGPYLLSRREDLAAVPPLQRFLLWVGLGVAAIWTVLGVAILVTG